MPESKAPESEDRKKEDLERVNQICDILNLRKEFSKPVRLGKKTAGNRPLRITAKSPELLAKTLQSARKLAEHDDASYNMISVKKDMTPLERKERRHPVKIMNEKKEGVRREGEKTKWVIRSGKVINMERRTPQEQEQEGD